MDTLKVLLVIFKKLGRNNPLFTYTIEYDSVTVECVAAGLPEPKTLLLTDKTPDVAKALDDWLNTI